MSTLHSKHGNAGECEQGLFDRGGARGRLRSGGRSELKESIVLPVRPPRAFSPEEAMAAHGR